jgi:putative oxidoreductase
VKEISTVTRWTAAHHSAWLDGLRILLGAVLFLKGLSFIMNKEMTLQVLQDNNYEFIPVLLLHYVIIFQMAHSVLIAIGLITRIAIAAQFPIVLGAAVLLLTTGSLAPLSSDLYLLMFVIFLLALFFVLGPGPLSVDARLRRGKEALAGSPR